MPGGPHGQLVRGERVFGSIFAASCEASSSLVFLLAPRYFLNCQSLSVSGGCDAGNLCMGRLSPMGGTLVRELEALEVNEKALIEVGGSQRHQWAVAAGSCFADSVSSCS